MNYAWKPEKILLYSALFKTQNYLKTFLISDKRYEVCSLYCNIKVLHYMYPFSAFFFIIYCDFGRSLTSKQIKQSGCKMF